MNFDDGHAFGGICSRGEVGLVDQEVQGVTAHGSDDIRRLRRHALCHGATIRMPRPVYVPLKVCAKRRRDPDHFAA